MNDNPDQSRDGMHRVKHATRKVGSHLHNHFIPHVGNDYIPRALKHKALLVYSLILIAVKVMVIVLPIALPSASLYSSAITSKNIINLTNQTRRNLGLAELNTNIKLMSAAQAKAEHMSAQQYFAHVSPTGVTPWSWIRSTGYAYQFAGENLAVHFVEAEDVQQGWLGSPTHRANIVNPRFAEIGVGVANGVYDNVPTVFVVQMFGQPIATPSKAVAVAPQTASKPKAPAPVPPAPKPDLTPVPPVETSQVAGEAVDESIDTIETSEPKPEITLQTSPKVDPATLKVTSQGFTYEVEIAVTHTSEVLLQLDSQWARMNKADGENIWKGSIAYDPQVLGNGAQLTIVATGETESQKTIHPLAWVSPSSRTQDFYIFTEGKNKTATFLGFITVSNLQDYVAQFYLYTIIFLGTCLLLSVVIKFEIQRHTVTAHAIFVIILAVFLSLI